MILNSSLLGQAPDTLWTKTYGDSSINGGYSVQQTTDGGYIIGGSFDHNDWLIKTDVNGDTLWTKIFSGIHFSGGAIQQTIDNGYILAGDSLLIKTDGIGETLWTKSFGDSNSHVLITSVQQTSDEGFIITGSISIAGDWSDVYLIKTDVSGDTLWTKTFGGTLGDEGNSVQKTTDGGYIISGLTGYRCCGRIPNMAGDIWLIKTAANGDTLWTKTYNRYGSDHANFIQQTLDGGYILTGISDIGWWSGIWLIKTDVNGDTLWTKTFSESSISGNSIHQTSDGGYIITGQTEPIENNQDVVLIKTDENGDAMWTKILDRSNWDHGRSVQQTSDGGYIVCGFTSSLDENADIWLIKIAPDVTSIGGNPHSFINGFQLQQNYPNPFNPSTTIEFTLPKSEYVELKVYNILGKEVTTLVSKRLNQGNHTYIFDGKNLASGIYYYQLVAGDFREVKKMILLK